ncbi:MAG TPA: NAD(P)-dependent oxidoreductase [Armatimonadota bacterium]|jgi:nucleoside-diphosphate-sugar epimerase
MEVWVAGATGVLGRHTVPQLIAAGHSVVGLARDLSKWPNPPPQMRFIPCDITASGQVIQAFAQGKPDAILHLATAIPTERPTAKDWQRNDAVRRGGTENLSEAALVADAYYIQQSVHYVMAPQGDDWINEDAPFQHSVVVDSAIDAERLTNKAFQRGLRGCILRPSTLYGADSPQTKAIVHAVKSGMPILVGSGKNFWSFIHPDDVASAIVRALEVQPPAETYNLSDDEPVRMADCLKWLAETLHAHPPKGIAPFLAKLALGGDMVDLLIASRRISNSRAKERLGWRPAYPTFRDGFTAELPRMQQPGAVGRE